MPTLNRGLLNSTALTNVGLVSAGLFLVSGSAMALPQSGHVIGGQATIVQNSPNQLTIDQTSNTAAINWQSFSIGKNQTTNFVQPNAGSVAINRVTGIDPSVIEGHLNANGQVVLVNPNGMLFTKTAQVNVGGLVASTSGISEANARAGNLVFDQGSAANARIVNNGSINAKNSGLVALVSPAVINNGVITARLGKVSLASGDKWTMDLYGDKLVNFALNDKVKGEVRNTGVISADGGQVQITADVAKDVVSNAINMGGVVEANSIDSKGGSIVLEANGGNVAVTGKLEAKGTEGGSISVNGGNVSLASATLDASGVNAGGTVSVGGKGTAQQADNVVADAGTTIKADAANAGNGGAVTVWSTGSTQYSGTVTAKGGAASGNGGNVETSGENLNIDGAKVDTSAPAGKAGQWLLDPTSFTIDSSAAQTIEADLKTGNVTVSTGTAPKVASSTGTVTAAQSGQDNSGNITVASAINWGGTAGGANSLTLSAYNNIDVNANIVDQGTGNIVLRADNAAQGAGQVFVQNGATVQTNGAVSVYYHPTTYTTPGVNGNDTPVAGQASNVPPVISGQAGTSFYMLVDNVADLNKVSTNLSGTYALGNSISNVGSFSPIGNAATPFTGVFDGNGGIGTYAISGVTASGSSYVGLFGNNAGTIRNVTIDGATIAGNQFAGALVGYNSGSLIGDGVKNVSVHGVDAANTSNSIGGVVGFNSPTGYISASEASGQVYVDAYSTYAGGFVGTNYGTIVAGAFNGAVTAGCDEIGGFAGGNFGYISGASATGSVTNGGTGSQVGGFAGLNGASVFGGNTYTGTLVSDIANEVVSNNGGGYELGGFVGSNQNGAKISGSSATGSVAAETGSSNLGGFAGDNLNAASIVNSGSTDNVTVADNETNVGGFIGLNNGLVTNGSVGSASTGSNVDGNGSNTGVGGGDAASSGPAAANTSAVVVGNNAMNVGGYIGWEQQGTISGIDISNPIVAGNEAINVGGLVGFNQGTLLNDKVAANVVVGANSGSVGGMVGLNSGVISGAGITGLVRVNDGTIYGGGVIGANYGVVSGSSFNGTVTAGCNEIGGFVGGNFATITDSTSSGLVQNGGGLELGGFAGENYGILTNDQAVNSTVMAAGGMLYIGGFVGYNEGTGTVTNGKFAGLVTVGDFVSQTGGYAGQNDGLLNGGAANAQVIGGNTDGNIAGFVGSNRGVVLGGTASGMVSVASNPVSEGGFVGGNNGSISGASSSDTVITGLGVSAIGGEFIGGIAGWNNGTVQNTSFTGNITAGSGASAVGGVVGYNAGLVSTGSANSSILVGDKSFYVGGGVGWNDAGGTVIDANYTGTITAGNNETAIGGIVGMNGSDATNGHGSFAAKSAVVESGTFDGKVSVGSNSFAVGGLVGWNSKWMAGNTASGTAYYGSIADGYDAQQSGSAVHGTGAVSGKTGTTYIHDANQNGCDERAGGNCFGTAGQEVIYVNANNASSVYGSTTAPDFSYFITGQAPGNASLITSQNVKGGDVLESQDQQANVLTGNVSANGQTQAGTYAIGLGTVQLNQNNANALLDYTVKLAPNGGSYTINKAELDINVTGTQVYGGSTQNVSFSYVGLKNGDSSAVVAGPVGYALQVPSTSNAGTYANGIKATGGTAANYTIVDELGTFTITPAPLTITAQGSQVYGGSTQNVSYTYAGLTNGDKSSAVTGVSYALNVPSTSNAGTYANGISAKGGVDTNYTITDGSGPFTITPAPLTVTATGTLTYGGSNPSVSYTYAGLTNGDTSGVVTGVSYGLNVPSTSNAGTYSNGISAKGGMNPNYTVTDGNGDLTINKADLSIVANDAAKEQGTANPIFTATFQGLVNGDSSSVITGLSITSPATVTSPVGNYSINPMNAMAQNYNLTYVPGVLTVQEVPASTGNITPIDGGSQGNLIPLPAAAAGTAQPIAPAVLQVAAGVLNQVNQIDCLKVNLEVRGVTTDSPIDCSAPLSVNGF